MSEIYIVLFILIFFLVSKAFGSSVTGILANMLIRVLSGIVFISVCNYLVFLSDRNLHVNINETSLVISAILGISGLCFLYLFQWILTIM
ncbi:MAG TPA: hypothetical protein DCZ23_05095 [Lachnospiraceae bacterium]|nr:hypothetical protein [Lachnospiraceae bacterium]